jgi:hypothetical protein
MLDYILLYLSQILSYMLLYLTSNVRLYTFISWTNVRVYTFIPQSNVRLYTFLCLWKLNTKIKHGAMGECVSMEVKFHAYLISWLDEDKWWASLLTSFTHSLQSRSGLKILETRKILCFFYEWIHGFFGRLKHKTVTVTTELFRQFMWVDKIEGLC